MRWPKRPADRNLKISRVFTLGGACSMGVSSLMIYYQMTQLDCPVFACSDTASGIRAANLALVASVVGVALLAVGLFFLFRSMSASGTVSATPR